MGLLLVLAFLAFPFAELWFILAVADQLGVGWTILLLIGDSILGSWLVRREGVAVWRRVQGELAQGQMPTTSLVDGVLILFAGALMLTPGFLTDLIGLLLLLPPTRAIVRRVVMRRYRNRLASGRGGRFRVQTFGFPGGPAGPAGPGSGPGPRIDPRGDDDVIDVDGDEIPRDRHLP